MKNNLKTVCIVLASLAILTGCSKESSEKQILTFKFAALDVQATITESPKAIVAIVPYGTDVTSLVPIITISEKASISPASGVPTDFTNPVVYTVTAEDGSKATYTATVTENPNGGGGGIDGDPTECSGYIESNTIWPDLGLRVDYIIDGMLTITGNALLTIEPGVTIMFSGVDGGIEVGENAGLSMTPVCMRTEPVAVTFSVSPLIFTCLAMTLCRTESCRTCTGVTVLIRLPNVLTSTRPGML